MQIGDGEIYLATAEGAITEPLPRDDAFGEETYSLCLDDAVRHVKVALLRAPNPFSAPDFAFASTDGFSKSFANPVSARDVVGRTRQAARDKGFDAALADLPRWIANCAGAGAGDDVSVALYWGSTSRPPPSQSEKT